MVSVLAALLIPSTRRPGATYEKPRNNSCAVALGGTPGESRKIETKQTLVLSLLHTYYIPIYIKIDCTIFLLHI